MIKRLVPVAALAAALLSTTAACAQVTALTHATVIDGTGSPPQSDITFVMQNGRISDMGPSSTVTPPAGASVIDLSGKFITPGIINAHGHVGANRDPQLRQYALYGVTTTTSMAFDPEDIVAFKEKQRHGDLHGARILTVKYRFMSAPMKPGSEYPTPEAARVHVDEIADNADFIKVWIDPQGGKYPRLTREYCAAVLDQARKHGKITMAHIVELADARMIVDEGVNILAHNVRDQVIDDGFIATLKQRNVSVISTLAREEAMFVFADLPGYIETPLYQKGLTPERLALLRTVKHDEQSKDAMQPTYRRMFGNDKINLKKLSDAGVKIGFGTDSGGAADRYFIQGFFEHRQMELMRDAGLTPMQIIVAFSKSNSELLGIDKDFGTLAKGKAADLLVVSKNPLDDITNMHGIEAVYLGGKKFE